MRRNLFWLSDEQWKRIEPHLPTDVRGVERVDDRRVISGIVHVLKSGCRWCDCPPAGSRLSSAPPTALGQPTPSSKLGGAKPAAFVLRGMGRTSLAVCRRKRASFDLTDIDPRIDNHEFTEMIDRARRANVSYAPVGHALGGSSA